MPRSRPARFDIRTDGFGCPSHIGLGQRTRLLYTRPVNHLHASGESRLFLSQE